MLAELQLWHAKVLAGLDEMDALTAQHQPPMDRLAAARLNLTKSSRRRSAILERAYPQLMTRLGPDQKARLQALKEQGANNLATSSRHISTWTLREISERWPEYRSASYEIRSAMRQRIRDEARLVYPLLTELGTHGNAA
jgi:hypothetical protein